jgi:tRNA-2-methylthio-N6-dimethylallyladenosine synthase
MHQSNLPRTRKRNPFNSTGAAMQLLNLFKIKNMKYFIKTFGCQMNISDSERIAAFMESNRYAKAETMENADLVIFNTCGIRQAAENRAYSIINNLRKSKGESVKIIMTGCLANRADVQKRMKAKVDSFMEIKNFPNEISTLINHNQATSESIAYLSINPKNNSEFQANVPIMTGCNNFCSYCVVPYARGREISRPAEEIINEVKKLVSAGYKHITLLGQNVNSYAGLNSKGKAVSFPQLLKKLNSISGNFWISFVSSHPKDMSNELIETVAKCKKVCEWIHLPVQAGNDEVLRKMNRKYGKQHYLKLIRKIRSEFKKYKPLMPLGISSDIIVGFPGETKTQFADSQDLMEKCKFDMVYFGQFSPRPGTAAWKMKDNVSKTEKARRENALNEILKQTAFNNNQKYLGKKLEVLIEKGSNGNYYGKTRTMKNVLIKSFKSELVGKIIKATIIKATTWNLEGII